MQMSRHFNVTLAHLHQCYARQLAIFTIFVLFFQPLRRLRLRGGRFRPLAGCALEAQDTPSTKRALSQCLRKSLAKIQGDDILIFSSCEINTNN